MGAHRKRGDIAPLANLVFGERDGILVELVEAEARVVHARPSRQERRAVLGHAQHAPAPPTPPHHRVWASLVARERTCSHWTRRRRAAWVVPDDMTVNMCVVVGDEGSSGITGACIVQERGAALGFGQDTPRNVHVGNLAPPAKERLEALDTRVPHHPRRFRAGPLSRGSANAVWPGRHARGAPPPPCAPSPFRHRGASADPSRKRRWSGRLGRFQAGDAGWRPAGPCARGARGSGAGPPPVCWHGRGVCAAGAPSPCKDLAVRGSRRPCPYSHALFRRGHVVANAGLVVRSPTCRALKLLAFLQLVEAERADLRDASERARYVCVCVCARAMPGAGGNASDGACWRLWPLRVGELCVCKQGWGRRA